MLPLVSPGHARSTAARPQCTCAHFAREGHERVQELFDENDAHNVRRVVREVYGQAAVPAIDHLMASERKQNDGGMAGRRAEKRKGMHQSGAGTAAPLVVAIRHRDRWRAVEDITTRKRRPPSSAVRPQDAVSACLCDGLPVDRCV